MFASSLKPSALSQINDPSLFFVTHPDLPNGKKLPLSDHSIKIIDIIVYPVNPLGRKQEPSSVSVCYWNMMNQCHKSKRGDYFNNPFNFIESNDGFEARRTAQENLLLRLMAGGVDFFVLQEAQYLQQQIANGKIEANLFVQKAEKLGYKMVSDSESRNLITFYNAKKFQHQGSELFSTEIFINTFLDKEKKPFAIANCHLDYATSYFETLSTVQQRHIGKGVPLIMAGDFNHLPENSPDEQARLKGMIADERYATNFRSFINSRGELEFINTHQSTNGASNLPMAYDGFCASPDQNSFITTSERPYLCFDTKGTTVNIAPVQDRRTHVSEIGTPCRADNLAVAAVATKNSAASASDQTPQPETATSAAEAGSSLATKKGSGLAEPKAGDDKKGSGLEPRAGAAEEEWQDVKRPGKSLSTIDALKDTLVKFIKENKTQIDENTEQANSSLKHRIGNQHSYAISRSGEKMDVYSFSDEKVGARGEKFVVSISYDKKGNHGDPIIAIAPENLSSPFYYDKKSKNNLGEKEVEEFAKTITRDLKFFDKIREVVQTQVKDVGAESSNHQPRPTAKKRMGDQDWRSAPRREPDGKYTAWRHTQGARTT